MTHHVHDEARVCIARVQGLLPGRCSTARCGEFLATPAADFFGAKT